MQHFHNAETLPKIIIDSRLSKYFTPHQQTNPKIRPSTARYNPPLCEKYSDVRERSKRILNHLKIKNAKIWCISHAIVLKMIGKEIDTQVGNNRGYIKFLEILEVE